jgi:hypothetical protein
MAKAPHLTGRIRNMIRAIYVADNQIKPSKAQEELLKRMKATGLNEIFGSNYPSRSTVSKELKSLRKRDETRSPESKGLDQPWSIFSLRKYPIPPETLPIVLHLWIWKRETLGGDFTIREAQWASRLYAVVKNISVEFLLIILGMYANSERICELTGESPPDTQVLDLFMFQKMTGQALTPERIEKILGQGEVQLFPTLTQEQANLWQEHGGEAVVETFENMEQLIKSLKPQGDSQNSRKG